MSFFHDVEVLPWITFAYSLFSGFFNTDFRNSTVSFLKSWMSFCSCRFLLMSSAVFMVTSRSPELWSASWVLLYRLHLTSWCRPLVDMSSDSLVPPPSPVPGVLLPLDNSPFSECSDPTQEDSLATLQEVLAVSVLSPLPFLLNVKFGLLSKSQIVFNTSFEMWKLNLESIDSGSPWFSIAGTRPLKLAPPVLQSSKPSEVSTQAPSCESEEENLQITNCNEIKLYETKRTSSHTSCSHITWQYSVLLHKLNGKVCIYTTNNFTKEAYLKEKIIKTKKFANMHIYS